MAGDGIGELAGVVDLDGGVFHLRLNRVCQLDVLLKERDHLAHQAFELRRRLRDFRYRLGDDLEEALFVLAFDGAATV